MTLSPHAFNASIRQRLLDLVWQQWTALGVAGYDTGASTAVVDLEALVLITTVHGRTDPRLFEEMLDWLWGNAHAVNVQRLRNIQKQLHLGDTRVLSAIADWLSQRTILSKWKSLVRAASAPPQAPEPLFRLPDGRALPWQGDLDPLFARHGLQCAPVQRREMSRPPNPRSAAALSWKLRNLFGVQARCEIILWLLTHERGHSAQIARATYYFPRGVENTLRELAVSGMALTAPRGRAITYEINPDEWLLFLRSWKQPNGFPRWIDWPRFFSIQERFMAAGTVKEMSPLLHASELRRVFEESLPLLEAGDLRTAFSAGRNHTGTEFTAVLSKDIESLYSRTV
jgi:hypothetical protein